MKTKNNILIVIGLIMLICSSATADNNDSDVFTITPTYTQEELNSMKMRFIKDGDHNDYMTYTGYADDKANNFIYTFYMANTYNNSFAQYEMYGMINEFYNNIGIEMDFTANAIAISYLKRSVVQGHDYAEWEMSRLLLCGIGIPKDTLVARELIYKRQKKERADKIWFIKKRDYPQRYENEKRERAEIRNERSLRINNQATLINSLIDTIVTKTSYTQDELALLKDYFIQYGDPKAYTTYMNFCPDVENKAMYTFYMANTHNSAIAQYQMYCMIRDFYASIGKEMDSTASAIALSYLRRSAEQGYKEAESEISN
jgi:hypothetical protein